MYRPDKNDVYFEFLDHLRESGKVNMFGSPSYLVEAFPELTRHESIQVFMAWADSFESAGEEE
jgi:hypothetical protein